MATLNPKQIINNLYGLIMEIDFHRLEDEIITELNNEPDKQIEKHLVSIKQFTAKLKAEVNRQRYNQALQQFSLLKKMGIDEIKKLIGPNESMQLQPLFRKFEELTENDEASILEDQQMLLLMEKLKERLENDENIEP